MTTEIPGTYLLDSDVIDDPYPFYRRLQSEAPVWRVPSTDVFVVSTAGEAIAQLEHIAAAEQSVRTHLAPVAAGTAW